MATITKLEFLNKNRAKFGKPYTHTSPSGFEITESILDIGDVRFRLVAETRHTFVSKGHGHFVEGSHAPNQWESTPTCDVTIKNCEEVLCVQIKKSWGYIPASSAQEAEIWEAME